MKCSNCTSNIYDKLDKFCNNCGHQLSSEKQLKKCELCKKTYNTNECPEGSCRLLKGILLIFYFYISIYLYIHKYSI